MKSATLRQLLTLNFYWIGLSFMWNSLHVIVLPPVLLHFVPDHYKNTYLGLLTFVGLIIAMIVQPVSGALSDRWSSRWGKRRPLMTLGTAFDFVFLAILGWAGGIGWLALGYIGLQLSSNIAHGPAQGLLRDQVPEGQLGQASGIKNLMDMAGLVSSSLIIGRLLSPETRHPVGVIGLVAIVLVAGAAATILGVHERPTNRGRKELSQAKSLSTYILNLRALPASLRLNVSQHINFWRLIASRFFFLSGIYGIQTFALYYLRDVLGAPNPIQLTGNLLASIILAVIVFSLAGGWLGDRLGHKWVLLAASLIGATGCLLLPQARTASLLLVYGSVVGVGLGLFLTANWALANEQAPAAEAGKFLGLTNLATAGAGVIGRLEGPLIDLLNNARPGAWWGYSMLFLTGAVCMLISASLLYWIKTSKVNKTSLEIAD
jgi:MFS family permease